jgi:membrane-bound ClpP family serine protease
VQKQLIGRHGIAVTAMLPAGAIRIEGRTIDAISEGMTIEKNTPIEVIAVRGNHLVVRPLAASTGESSASSIDAVIPDPFDDSLS